VWDPAEVPLAEQGKTRTWLTELWDRAVTLTTIRRSYSMGRIVVNQSSPHSSSFLARDLPVERNVTVASLPPVSEQGGVEQVR
jgi:hypothetical protein